jgi:hypothetical protein
MRILLLLVLFPLLSFGQKPPRVPNNSKDFHHRKPLSIDELLEKNDPKGYKAMTAKSNFMVVSNYRNGKRWRYFEGDVFRFKSKDGKSYEEDIAFIDDSTFTIYRYNNNISRMEEFTFTTSEISAIYKNKKGRVWRPGLISMAGIVPFALIDWIWYKNPPHENKDFLWIAPIVGVGNTLIFGHKHFFNKQKLGNNKDLRIIKPL